MTYFHARMIEGDFEAVVERTRAALQKHGSASSPRSMCRPR